MTPTYVKKSLPIERGVVKNGWRILGPGGGGAQYIPTIKPDDPDTVLVACDMTGSYITYNGGETWKELNFKVWVGAFAFDPSIPTVIYSGATGLYRSEDAGRTWQLVFPDPAAVIQEKTVGDHADHSYLSSDNWPGGKIEAISIDPDDSRRIFIGINCGQLKLFCSTDRGESWTERAQFAGSHYLKAYLDPGSSKVDRKVYYLTDGGLFEFSSGKNAVQPLSLPSGANPSDFSCGIIPATGKSVFYIASPGHWVGKEYISGAYRSIDLGKTWEGMNSGLDADLVPGQARNLNHLATCPSDARIIYLSAQEPTNENSASDYFGIFKSEDMGQTWQWVMRIGHKNPENRTLGWVEKDFNTAWAGAPFYMSVAPSNPAICYATDWGTTYRTVDGGKTWQQLYCETFPDGSVSTRGLDVTNIYYICFDPFNPDHMALACTDIGAFHSKNGGKSWSHTLKGVPTTWCNTCYRVIFDPQVEGKAWAIWSNCHDMPRPKMFRSGRFDQYQGGVTKSEDGLESWKSTSQGLPKNCVPTDILLDPQTPAGTRTLYVAIVGKGVYKSIDDGQNWFARNTGISGNLNAWRLVILPSGSLYLLVCRGLAGSKAVDGALYRSDDGAESWKIVPLPPGVNFPNDLCFDPNKPARMYLAAWPIPIEDIEQHGGLWRTEDGGITWTNTFDQASHVYGVTLDPEHPSTIFITNFEGAVYRSDDRGDHWKRLRGYNFKWAKQPILDPYDAGMLYITTFGSSVWYGSRLGFEGYIEDY